MSNTQNLTNIHIASVNDVKMDYYFITGNGWMKRIWFDINLSCKPVARVIVPFYMIHHATYTRSTLFKRIYAKYNCTDFEMLRDKGMYNL